MHYYIELSELDSDDSKYLEQEHSTLAEAKQHIKECAQQLTADCNEWVLLTVYGAFNNPEGADKSEFSVWFHPVTRKWYAGAIYYGGKYAPEGYNTMQQALERTKAANT